MNKTITSRVRGVTLVELLVAVAITAGMLLATSMIFKSATDASGKALATTEIMSQLRTLTRQLEQDFKQLQSDMPMALIFEMDSGGFRQDRITFFANGDFQTTDGSFVGNTARVFYGQSQESINPLGLGKPGDVDEYPLTSDRRILTRRQKIITPLDVSSLLFGNSPPSMYPELLDYISAEQASLSGWKQEPFVSFVNSYFVDDSTLPNYRFSIVRRPDTDLIKRSIRTDPVVQADALQRLYMTSDLTDFKVEIWFNNGPYANLWFPNEVQWDEFDDEDSENGLFIPFAFYWNVNRAPNFNGAIPIAGFAGSQWWSDVALQDIKGTMNPWPKALRFTFTLYDKNRRHFPEGQTFSYVVKLPER